MLQLKIKGTKIMNLENQGNQNYNSVSILTNERCLINIFFILFSYKFLLRFFSQHISIVLKKFKYDIM